MTPDLLKIEAVICDVKLELSDCPFELYFERDIKTPMIKKLNNAFFTQLLYHSIYFVEL